MLQYLPFHLNNNHFLLSSGRCVFWEEEKILIASDLHLGKSGHFRKSGIGIPQSVLLEDMQRLIAQIQFYKPDQLIIVGDLFHSEPNREHDFFMRWRNDLGYLPVHLVKGNHDILHREWYEEANIVVHDASFSIKDFCFVHDIADKPENEKKYCFSGHIHPAIIIRGAGKQALRFPCFYFGNEYAVLPAFGKFTGTYVLEPKKKDHVFALVENKVMQIQ